MSKKQKYNEIENLIDNYSKANKEYLYFILSRAFKLTIIDILIFFIVIIPLMFLFKSLILIFVLIYSLILVSGNPKFMARTISFYWYRTYKMKDKIRLLDYTIQEKIIKLKEKK